MTLTFLLTILVFGIVFILMSIKFLLKRDEFTLTCSNRFGDGVDTCFLCGTRGDACRQSGERNGKNSIGQL